MVQTKSQAVTGIPDTVAESDQRKVLVLDDEEAVRAVLGRFLQEYGFQPLGATSVDEAVNLLADTSVVAIILDVRLSGGRLALGLLGEIRRQPDLATTPAIVMTGVALSDEEEATITRHRAHLFYKPEGLTALVGFLRQIADRDQPCPEPSASD